MRRTTERYPLFTLTIIRYGADTSDQMALFKVCIRCFGASMKNDGHVIFDGLVKARCCRSRLVN
jgi:hypothetical protein